MCEKCFIESGFEYIENEKVLKAFDLINEVYDAADGGVGAQGHIVFDDMNVSDYDVQWCLALDRMPEYSDWIDQETWDICKKALEYFQTLTEQERYCALVKRERVI